jgi:hypothetical protein
VADKFIPPAVVTSTATIPGFKRITGLGHNKIYDLFHIGEVDTVVTERGRRLVLLPSWEAYLERRRRGQQRDPAEKAAASAAFEASLLNMGAVNAARARKAISRKKGAARAARGVEAAIPALARPRG